MNKTLDKMFKWMFKRASDFEGKASLAEAAQEELGKNGSANALASDAIKLDRRMRKRLADLSRASFPSTYQNEWGEKVKMSEDWLPVYKALRRLSEEAERHQLPVFLTDKYDAGVGETMTIKAGGEYNRERLAYCSYNPAISKAGPSNVATLVPDGLREMALEAIQAIYQQAGGDFRNYYNEPALGAVAEAAGVAYHRMEV